MSGATVGVMAAQKIAAAGGGAAINTHIGVGGSATAIESASVSPSGSNRYMFGVAAAYTGDTTAFKYGGTGGTSLTQVGTDTALGGVATVNFWDIAPGPTGSTTAYADISATGSNAISAVFATGVNQATPAEALQTNTGTSDGFQSSMVATITVTGVESEQVVPVGLGILAQSGVTIVSVVAGANTTVERTDIGTVSGENQTGTAILTGTAAGTSLTLSATITVSATFGTFHWLLGARPLTAA